MTKRNLINSILPVMLLGVSILLVCSPDRLATSGTSLADSSLERITGLTDYSDTNSFQTVCGANTFIAGGGVVTDCTNQADGTKCGSCSGDAPVPGTKKGGSTSKTGIEPSNQPAFQCNTLDKNKGLCSGGGCSQSKIGTCASTVTQYLYQPDGIM